MSSDSTGTTPSQTGDEAGTSAERPTQRILIGSQRDRGIVAEAKAKPVTPAAPLATPTVAPTSSPPAAPTTQSMAEEPPIETPTVRPPAAKQRMHYPPPNIRDQLSPELQAEYEAALGELSFDALMNEPASIGSTAAEL